MPAAMVTVMQPYQRLVGTNPTISPLAATDDRVLGYVLTARDTADILVLCPDRREASVADLRMSGELFWLRFSGDRLERFLAFNATSLAVGSETVFDYAEAAPLVTEQEAPLRSSKSWTVAGLGSFRRKNNSRREIAGPEQTLCAEFAE
jgi:hypothetical protein